MATESSRPVPLYKSPFVWAFIVGALSLTALRPLQLAMRKAPPPLLTVERWELIDHNGEPFSSDDLEGRVFIADFFFTSCPGPCIELTRNLQKIEERVRDKPEIALVSFSVDPETDTPEKLRAYRDRFGIDTDQWVFLTAKDRDAMVQVLVDQMKLHVGEKEAQDGDEAARDQAKLYDISHVARFALFDQRGDLRAMATTDSHGMTRLLSGAELLVEKGPGGED